ncbi:hypothetical protein BKA62DRAFT_692398 [Auriculariales sp. MPI-PUGE-AT-0066]|nr:hypothetical protein BKA62DRAFT_692398 [Auriculariales sp. MPI-PUGE-AT-0066]
MAVNRHGLLAFASFDKSNILIPANLAIPRIAIMPGNNDGDLLFQFVPPAELGPGVLDEGRWPRLVDMDGELREMSLNEWDSLKLSLCWECCIPSQGFPTARLRQMARPAVIITHSYAHDNMSIDGSSFAHSTMDTAWSSVSSRRATSYMSVDSRSSITSTMSVDSSSTVRRADTTGTQPTSDRLTLPAPTALAAECPPSREAGTRKKATLRNAQQRAEIVRSWPCPHILLKGREARDAKRAEYRAERRNLTRMLEDAVLMKEIQQAHDLRKQLRNADEIEQLRRLADLQAAEKIRHQLSEPVELDALSALQQWRARSDAWDQVKHDTTVHMDSIPFPTLFRAPCSARLVNELEVARFLGTCLAGDYCSNAEAMTILNRLRIDFHPDRFSARAFEVTDGCAEDILAAVTCVSKVINALYDNICRHAARSQPSVGT